MGEIGGDRKVSEKWHRVGKNKKVPARTEAGGRKNARAQLLELECNTSAWLQKDKNKEEQNKKIQRDAQAQGMVVRAAQV